MKDDALATGHSTAAHPGGHSLDDLTDEGSPLAEVALIAGDAGLNGAGGGFLLERKKANVSVLLFWSIICRIALEKGTPQRSSTR